MSEQIQPYVFLGLTVFSGILLILLTVFVSLYIVKSRKQAAEKRSYEMLNKTAELPDSAGKTAELSVQDIRWLSDTPTDEWKSIDIELDITMIHTQESIDG